MIEARDITKRFGSHAAVDGVSLAVAPGEFVTLLGPSGCGKTTLLRVLAGFEMPDAGTVILAGEDITRTPPHRRNLNQVFQSYALFPHLSVADNVAFGLRMRGVGGAERRRRVQASLEAVALTGLENRRPDQLSGGQRQRVALARALVCEPKVLLLDEPLSALDAKLRRGMQLELKALQRRSGISFLFVTHDQQEALSLSDRIAIMHGGRLEQVGTPEEIYRRPRTAFAADFIGQANLLSCTVLQRTTAGVRVRAAEGWEVTIPWGDTALSAEIRLSVRPEKVLVDVEARDAAVRFAAQVEQRAFEGAVDRLVLRTASGLRLHASIAAEAATGSECQPGRDVLVSLRVDDLVPVIV